MALLLETNLGGDLVIDLDIEGSPALCKNILKLAKIRYYTGSLLYNVHANRFCQGGDPTGTGKGGACIFGVIDSEVNDDTTSKKRFLKSTSGRRLSSAESRERGRVVAMELPQTKDTIGSQFLITLGQGRAGDGMDGYLLAGEEQESTAPLSLGVVTEDDDNVLDKIERSYCDPDGRPYADVRIVRMLVLHDPFPDPPGLMDYLKERVPDMLIEGDKQVMASPDRSKPPQESVPERIPANELEEDKEETEQETRQRHEKEARQEDHQRAVVLELLGDLPSAEIKAPEHVLFVCKLNAVTQDEDLELIFSRFDQNCKVEIIRDQETGSSLQYAFIEFSNKQQCVEAYFKMNNALVDDRRIKVDFSQSVSKLWNKHTQRMRMPKNPEQDSGGPPLQRSNNNSNNNNVNTNKSAPRHDRHPHGPNTSREERPPPQRSGGGPDSFGRSRRPDADNRGRRDADNFDNHRPPPPCHNDNNQNHARRYNGNDDRFREDQHRRDRALSRDDDFHRHGDRDDERMRRDRHEHHTDHHRRHEHDNRRRRDENAEDGGENIRSKSRDIRRGHDYDEDRRRYHNRNDDDHRRRHEHERRHHANSNDKTGSRGHRDERRPGRGEEGHRERSRHHSHDDRHRGDDKMKHHRINESDRDDVEERNIRREERPPREVADDEDSRRRTHEHRRRDDDDDKDRHPREGGDDKERRRRKHEHRRRDDEEEEEPRKHKREISGDDKEKKRHRHKHKKRDKDDDEERRRRKKARKGDEDVDERKSRKREKRHRRSEEDQKRRRSRSRSVNGEDESR